MKITLPLYILLSWELGMGLLWGADEALEHAESTLDVQSEDRLLREQLLATELTSIDDEFLRTVAVNMFDRVRKYTPPASTNELPSSAENELRLCLRSRTVHDYVAMYPSIHGSPPSKRSRTAILNLYLLALEKLQWIHKMKPDIEHASDVYRSVKARHSQLQAQYGGNGAKPERAVKRRGDP